MAHVQAWFRGEMQRRRLREMRAIEARERRFQEELRHVAAVLIQVLPVW